MLVAVSALVTLKKSTCGVKLRLPKRNDFERRRSSMVTASKRSSPRSLRSTVWVARVIVTPAAAACARVTEAVDTYG